MSVYFPWLKRREYFRLDRAGMSPCIARLTTSDAGSAWPRRYRSCCGIRSRIRDAIFSLFSIRVDWIGARGWRIRWVCGMLCLAGAIRAEIVRFYKFVLMELGVSSDAIASVDGLPRSCFRIIEFIRPIRLFALRHWNAFGVYGL